MSKIRRLCINKVICIIEVTVKPIDATLLFEYMLINRSIDKFFKNNNFIIKRSYSWEKVRLDL